MNIQNKEKAKLGWSIEITPNQAKKIEKFTDILPQNTTVNVTCLPGTDAVETIQTAEKLQNNGMNAVPHIAARSLRDRQELDSLLEELTGRAAITEVLIIGGGGKEQIGEFSDTLSILKTGLLQKHGITKIGVAGHPEGNADISDEELKKALFEKNKFAEGEGLNMYIETQFCFDPELVLKWEKRIRSEGNKLPIHVGIPGPATIKALFKFARLSGIGNSMSFLTKQARNISKLLTIQSPDELLSGLLEGVNKDKGCLIQNLHFYPFGGFSETADYIKTFMNDGEFNNLDKIVKTKNKLAG